jgi:hypothetical protein
MSLSGKAQAIVREGREGLRPEVGERERLEALLDARLATAATATAAGGKLLFGVAAWRIALGVALVGGSGVFALRWQPDVPTAAVSAAPTPRVPVAVSPAVQEAMPEPPLVNLAEIPTEAPSKAPVLPAVAAPRGEKDQLALEVALLSRATSALRAGRASDALKALDEHKRKFPEGFLTIERRAARAQALCALKRVSEGRAELARLAPQSPAAARTKQVCDAVAAQSEEP